MGQRAGPTRVVEQHVVTDVPVATPEDTVSAVRTALAGRRYASIAAVAVCDGDRLAGLIRMEDLFGAASDRRAFEVMDRVPPAVVLGDDQQVAAWKAVRHEESTLAVVDQDRRFVGMIPPTALLRVLLTEHEEDLSRLGGFLHDAAAAREATAEPVARRYLHRMPWLLVGLAGAIVAAAIVGSFKRQLEATVLLAFFVPGIVYMADAVGTQTETLIIRGLSVGVPIATVVRRELGTGLLVGVTIAATFIPVAVWRWGDAQVALAAGLALLAACSTATVVAMALPWAIHRLGRDPAFGSGPLATVIQDLLSILIYFAVAGAIIR
ncbi:MAG: magnesium transporter [Actinomycetota bacterium]